MSFFNVRLLLKREIIDQLRDRRMLFMIFVLPMLLYPLMGTSFLQVSQFIGEKPSRILVLHSCGDEGLSEANAGAKVPLLDKDGKRLSPELFAQESQAKLLELEIRNVNSDDAVEAADDALAIKACDAVLVLPVNVFGHPESSVPEIVFTTAKEKSQIAQRRLESVLNRWNKQLGKENLKQAGLQPDIASPLKFANRDIAAQTRYQGASLWSKILPIMLILWALTGAFYPSIDLCAGEKERGTLETLLCSPALRSEIVLGKLGTIIVFSMLTAILNLLGIGLTGWLFLTQIPGLSSPAPSVIIWLLLALVPVSALFSSLCLALAAFARSSKEGQYYLTPLMLIVMPLALIPISPGIELTLGNAIIPITGIVLLLGQCIEGNLASAAAYLPVVGGVTLASCFLAVRWAIRQFNSESVLFRESERFNLAAWIRYTIRHREPLPGTFMAIACGMTILTLKYFANFTFPQPKDFGMFALSTVMLLVTVVMLPAVIFALIFTLDARKTLLLKRPRSLLCIPMAAVLAIAVHPAAMQLNIFVQYLYPIPGELHEKFTEFNTLFVSGPLWTGLLLIALTPAVCEELAFRGFILSGLKRGDKWQAILISSLFFGATHALLQQSISACFIGLLIGYVALRSNSIFPCMVYHFTHNALAYIVGRYWPEESGYSPWVTAIGLLLGILVLWKGFGKEEQESNL